MPHDKEQDMSKQGNWPARRDIFFQLEAGAQTIAEILNHLVGAHAG